MRLRNSKWVYNIGVHFRPKWPCNILVPLIIIEFGGIGELCFAGSKSDKLVGMSEIVGELAPTAKNPFFRF